MVENRALEYVVNVMIIEARHLFISNADSVVRIQIGKNSQLTNVQRQTDCPFYNECFVFTMTRNEEAFLNEMITLTVIQPRRKFRRRKIIGMVKMDMYLVWSQKHHHICKKWIPLAGLESNLSGFLKIDVNILIKNDNSYDSFMCNDMDVNDEIEGNLLLPTVVKTDSSAQKAIFTFSIFHAEVGIKPGLLCKSVRLRNLQIAITFAGHEVKSTIAKGKDHVAWNESLKIREMFPTFCQRIKIQMFDMEHCSKRLLGECYVHLKDISDPSVVGFLPTYGPSFIYFYNTHDDFTGKLLLAIKTDVVSDYSRAFMTIEKLLPVQDSSREMDTLLFCIIESVTMLDKNVTEPRLQLEFNGGFSSIENIPLKMGQFYNFMDLSDEKPCLVVVGHSLDFRRRLFHSNVICFIVSDLKNAMKIIESKVDCKNHYCNCSATIHDDLIILLNNFEQNCHYYLNASGPDYNELDQKRTIICRRIFIDALQSTQNLLTQNFTIITSTIHFDRECLQAIRNFIDALETIIDDVQECFPAITISLLNGSKKFGNFRGKPRYFFHAAKIPERGVNCSVIQEYMILPPVESHSSPSQLTGIIRGSIWLGDVSDKKHCLNSTKSNANITDEIPNIVLFKKKHLFHCSVHIIQAILIYNDDLRGLLNSFVRVSFCERTFETTVCPNTLNPQWHQTILIPNVNVYGKKMFVKENPPAVVVEVYEKIKGNKIHLHGRALIKPIVNIPKHPVDDDELKFKWMDIENKHDANGLILMCAQLTTNMPEGIDMHENFVQNQIIEIPECLRMKFAEYRVESLLWSIHGGNRKSPAKLKHIKVDVFAGQELVASCFIKNLNKSHLFLENHHVVVIKLPEIEEYLPALTVCLYDHGTFGRSSLSAAKTVHAVEYLYNPLSKTDYKMLTSVESQVQLKDRLIRESIKPSKKIHVFYRWWSRMVRFFKRKVLRKKYELLTESDDFDETDEFSLDWWSKFYASCPEYANEPASHTQEIPKIQIYPKELEKYFDNFTDPLQTFPMYKSKRTGDHVLDQDKIVATLKGNFQLYKFDEKTITNFVTDTGDDLEHGVLSKYAKTNVENVLVRVYIVRGLNLAAKDFNKGCDPYAVVRIGRTVLSDKKKYLIKQLNPYFGRLFEIQTQLALDSTLQIGIWDYDRFSPDDLVGETFIDLENRFHSKYRARCGLPEKYSANGFNAWRDFQNPSQILTELCSTYNLPEPEQRGNQLFIGNHRFTTKKSPSLNFNSLCLEALNNWHKIPLVGFNFVPEHLETRTLYNPEYPGIPQGKLQLWIDIFPTNVSIPLPVNIELRKPIPYQLRVIIFNTSDVILDDLVYMTGARSSDIYVKGWMDPNNVQKTDVHYRSYTGEGNFNWRFIFPFNYIPNEDRIVIVDKDHIFAAEYEMKIPCRLNVQVWDSDKISADDFLGDLTLNLQSVPKPATNSKRCKLKMLDVPKSKCVNLFRIRKVRGWWPCRRDCRGKYELTGKIEMELHLLNGPDALSTPVGVGREPPEALPVPNRPDTSIAWFLHPFQATYQLLCGPLRTKLYRYVLIVVAGLILVITVMEIPRLVLLKFLRLT